MRLDFGSGALRSHCPSFFFLAAIGAYTIAEEKEEMIKQEIFTGYQWKKEKACSNR